MYGSTRRLQVRSNHLVLTMVAKTMPFRTNICFSGVEDGRLSVICCKMIDGGVWRDGETYSIKTNDGHFNGLVKRTG